MKQNYFIVVLAHSIHGRLRRIHIPHQAIYGILALAVLGCFSLFGFISSYARMALKVASYNALKQEAEVLRANYRNLQKIVSQTDEQLATLKLNGRSLADLGWKWPARKYAAMSWYIPLIYAAIAYGIVWVSGLGGFPNREFMQGLVGRMGLQTSPAVATALYVFLIGSFGLVRSLSSALGEEIGWRGYALPRLGARLRLGWASIILGAIWASWHLPLFFLPDSDTYHQSFIVYITQVTAISVAMAWLWERTGRSLLLIMLMHAAINNTQDIIPAAVPGAEPRRRMHRPDRSPAETRCGPRSASRSCP